MRHGFTFALAFVALAMSARAAETEVSLKTATGTLWGTEASPAQGAAAPVALMLAGSGPTDRNGNGPTLRTDTYKLLAAALGERGIATLRIDKRGIGQSSAAMVSEADLRIQSYGDDAKAWAADLRARTGAPCVWLIGHSEGALIAELAAQDNRDICGLILLSGAGRKAADVLREQLANLPDPLKAQAFSALAELEAGHTVTSPPPQLVGLFRPSVQPYLISWLALDPAALLARLKLPVLIVQGDTDLQVSLDDARRLAAARPDAKLVILAGVNHILKVAPADRAANLASYGDPTLPLAPTLAGTIASFMQAGRP
ncbi:MAG TPA: alpha/beta fold hydrolase [Rhizomicrobium sp.]|jgi:pimeloyl-ACP methyl ester carboxylesterase|nr:alpha/beta fold hydrolase [Rhizomicrobium sp.]